MKKYIFVLLISITLLFSGCEVFFPQYAPTPTVSASSTYTPMPTEAATPTLAATIAPTEVITDTPAPLVPTPPATSTDLSGIDVITPVIIDIDDYMAGSYYKAGDGFQDAVDLTYVTSSSFLAPQAGNTYLPENLYDFDLNTVWCEGRTDYGIGEWALYRVKAQSYAPNAIITKVEIINGYIKADDLFSDNSMAKKIIMYVDGEEWCILDFVVSKEIQQFDIPDISLSTTDNREIKFELLEVYEGDVYKDTCITAIEFAGTGIY
ncbi:MAG: hypothetical protein AB1Z23_08610 [Eubacteriales bacterium]